MLYVAWSVTSAQHPCASFKILSKTHHHILLRRKFHSSNRNTVRDFVRRHVIVRQLLPVIPHLDDARYLCQLLPELHHGLLHWLLCEVLVRIHAQVKLQEEREDRSFGLEANYRDTSTWWRKPSGK